MYKALLTEADTNKEPHCLVVKAIDQRIFTKPYA